jgi:steroid 5-alpha reductase family enzyme
MPPLFLITAYISLMLFVTVFLWATLVRNNGYVDILWGLGFVAIAWVAYGVGPEVWSRLIPTILVTIWGLRLALHIGARNLGRPEDFRYAKWREEWGSFWVIRSFGQIYLLQWIFIQLVSIPIVLALAGSGAPTPWLIAGSLVWSLGFFFEAVGEYQLAQFKKDPRHKGKLMTTGLWSWTRHPNYFGEATLWWGIALIAYGDTGNYLAFLGPLTIGALLIFVSGVPLLEAKYKGRRDWEIYAKRTSAFIPRPPRR